MSFPTYNIFSKEAETIPSLTPEQMKKCIEDIKKLDQNGADYLYMLIRYTSIVDGDETVYNTKFNRNKTTVCDLESMPDKLQKMIFCMVRKHLQETAITQHFDVVLE